MILESGHLLLDQINDVLDIVRLEAGTTELHEEIVEVAPLINACVTMVSERARRSGVTVNIDIPAGSLPPLRADAARLKQAVNNLLSNAVKFTGPGGTATVRARHMADGGLVLQITDTGVGIAADDIPKALARFQQIDSGLNRMHEGCGLGLPLAKSLIELHGGTLDLQSELGGGTTVTVRFPAHRIVPEAATGS